MKKIVTKLLILTLALSAPLYAYAKSKYTRNFISHFQICKPYIETRYNVVYNSHDTYEIKGYTPDGSGKCIYVETNEWKRGRYVTTCLFDPKQHEEYFLAMLNPDMKRTVSIKGMAFVNSNEKAVYLKYYNTPSVCSIQRF